MNLTIADYVGLLCLTGVGIYCLDFWLNKNYDQKITVARERMRKAAQAALDEIRKNQDKLNKTREEYEKAKRDFKRTVDGVEYSDSTGDGPDKSA